MNWKNKPYWLRGGLIAIPLSVLLVPVSFFLARVFGAGQTITWYLIPEFLLTAMDLGMRGTPAGMGETITKLLLATIIFLTRVFVIGAILGALYGLFSRWKKQKYFIAFLAAIFLIGIAAMSYRTKNVYEAYSEVSSPQDCESSSKKLIENFGVAQCYHQLAQKQSDIRICDLIDTVESEQYVTADTKWFCYEEVAHKKNDPSICEKIPAETFNEHNVNTGRRDGCFLWFKQCDKIVDPGWKANCLESQS